MHCWRGTIEIQSRFTIPRQSEESAMQSESMGEPKDLRDFEHGEYVVSDKFGPSDG